MIRTIIVDDEPNAVNFLANALAKYSTDVEVVGKIHSVEDAEILINSTTFDLLLLDIELIDGTGFDLLQRIENRNFDVVFITAYNQHAIKAFRFSAVDYLLKPLNIKELLLAIDKVRVRLRQNTGSTIDYKALLENIKGVKMNRLAINSQTETLFVSLTEIVAFEAYGNYTKVILSGGNQVIASRTLKDYELMLPDDTFIRIHNSYVINIQFVKKYLHRDGFSVLMHDGITLPVAIRRKEAFESFLKRNFTSLG